LERGIWTETALKQIEGPPMCGEKGKKEGSRKKPLKRKRSRIAKLEEKIEHLQNRLKEVEEKNTTYLTQLKYLQADYENCLKRAQREIERVSKYGNERLITNLLEILDELELASAVSMDESISEEVRKGVRMTLEKLRGILFKEGLEVIECKNKPFDPKIHQAVSREYSKDHKEGIVIKELRKGYLLRGKVIRPSAVVVSSSKSDSPGK